MAEKMVTRSFLTTVVKTEDGKINHFPNLRENQVKSILEMQNTKYASISEELVRYGCSENDFLKISAPILKANKSET